MPQGKRRFLVGVYVLATIQFAWCYFWLTRPYVNTLLYERGKERMPFQGRLMMMLPMRLAHSNLFLHWMARPFVLSHFWFPRPVQPEVLVQAMVNIVCLLVTGVLTTRIYQASSRRRLLTPFVYPLVLVICGATYVMHTVQNFRFIYDLPSLAFFSAAMYLVYFRRHWSLFVALFLVATLNRETTLLLLPLYMIDAAFVDGELEWRRLWQRRTLAVVLPLAAYWIVWQMLVRHIFAHNPSEFYPRLNWNVKSLLVPQAWPQLLSACGYLLLFVVVMRRQISDARLRAWLWLVPLWIAFMFSFGILIETRVFGELIPLVVCASMLIMEEMLLVRIGERSRSRWGERPGYQPDFSGRAGSLVAAVAGSYRPSPGSLDSPVALDAPVVLETAACWEDGARVDAAARSEQPGLNPSLIADQRPESGAGISGYPFAYPVLMYAPPAGMPSPGMEEYRESHTA